MLGDCTLIKPKSFVRKLTRTLGFELTESLIVLIQEFENCYVDRFNFVYKNNMGSCIFVSYVALTNNILVLASNVNLMMKNMHILKEKQTDLVYSKRFTNFIKTKMGTAWFQQLEPLTKWMGTMKKRTGRDDGKIKLIA